jgi:hypothetical protein
LGVVEEKSKEEQQKPAQGTQEQQAKAFCGKTPKIT